jgi:uncharacterized membrane protein SpoIIM required for sporulation
MRETKFIDQNRNKWQEFEQVVEQKDKDPEKLSELFIQVTDDLSYARTFYPNRSVRVYLNNLAQRVFGSIYKTQRFSLVRIVDFWTKDIPRLIYLSRKEMLISLIFFSISMAIGIFSNSQDPDFPRAILGSGYVDMTIKNIEKGDPMAVYKNMNEIDMFFYIAYNNVQVMFRMFLTGIFFAIGTLAALLYNGIMIGTFHYIFYQYGVLTESLLTVWIHGTFEISSIVLAGGAGLVLGKGLVFPGTYSRMQAFQISAGRGLMIMLGIVPVVIAAAIFESFLTRYTEIPDLFRFIFILLSAAFILGYFVWYPWVLARKGKFDDQEEPYVRATSEHQYSFNKIQSNGELFYDTFYFIRSNLKPVLWVSFLVSLIYCSTLIIGSEYLGGGAHFSYEGASFWNLANFFDYNDLNVLFVLNVLGVSASVFLIMYLVLREAGKEISIGRSLLVHGPMVLAVVSMINAILLIPVFFAVVGLLLVTPFLLLWLFVAAFEGRSLVTSLGRAISLIGSQLGKMILLFAVMSLVCFVFYFFISSPFLFSTSESLAWLFPKTGLREVMLNAFYYFVAYVGLQLFLPILTASSFLAYFTLLEVHEAAHLRSKIDRVGRRDQIYGIDKE